jgi:4'-phosphopantetheinyl transferase EntD
MLGPAVSVGFACPGSADPAQLMPEERAGLCEMVPKRQREYAAGRVAVRMATFAAGAAPFAVPSGADRAPLWPRGVVGSITHSSDACLAVISRDGPFASVGIDLERERPLHASVTDAIIFDADRDANPAAQRALGTRFGIVVFSAKEAAYKCQFPLTGSLFDFDAMSICLSPDDGSFVATFERPAGLLVVGTRISGRFAFAAGHVLTTAAITREQWSTLSVPDLEFDHA